MKRLLILVCALVLFIPTALVLTQESSIPTLEITGVNASGLPVAVITANVLDSTGKPLPDLTLENFELSGTFAEFGRVVSVESTADETVSFGVVLVVDTSSSMAGSPIDKAKEAARLFVNSIGANDPVAIIGFNQDPYLAQDFTTDKVALNIAIDNLVFGGQTALYDATVLGIQKAAEAPVSRRAVIILSDGAEFGNSSVNSRGAGLEEALQDGVSVYTIGLGFGTDREYLRSIAEGTNAQYNESPSPEALAGIYAGLAQLFRSQYIVTLEADVPLDGTEYDLTLQATTPIGDTNQDTATLRAPIPVPIVSLPEIPTPIDAITTIAPIVLADDTITSLVATVNGVEVPVENGAITIDPATFAPGNIDLSFTVTDEEGDSGSVSGTAEIAALPSAITIAFEPDSTIISDITQVTITGEGQTALTNVNYAIGDTVIDVTDAPSNFAFVIEPITLAAGEQTLTVIATNEGGATTEQSVRLLVEPVAASIELVGFDQPIGNEPFTFSPVVITQAGSTITETTATLGETALSEPFTIDPFAFPAGTLPLTVSVTDSNGQVSTASTDVTISPIAPRVTTTGVADGDEISAPIAIDLDIATQGNIDTESVVLTVGDAVVDSLPFTVDPLNFAVGELPISATVTDANGETTTQAITVNIAKIATQVSIGEGFAGTFSTPFEIPLSVQGQSPIQTVTVEVNGQTFEFVPNADGTFPAIIIDPAQVGANGDFVAVMTITTEDGEVTTVDVPFTIEGLPTEQPTEEATAEETETTNNVGDATTVAMVDTGATQTAQANATASQVAITATGQASVVSGTASSQTQAAMSNTRTSELTVTAQSVLDANATIAMQITGTAQANATATMESLSNADATASLVANATNTANANATSNANATGTREVRNATATQNAVVLENANGTATINAQATATQNINLTATSVANVATTGAMIVQATSTARADASATANVIASSTAEQNALIADQTATGEANLASTASALATTQAETTVEATVTEEATAEETVTEEETPTPVVEATLTPVGGIQTTGEEAPPVQTDFAPYLLCGGAILLLILLLFLLSRGRSDKK